MFNGASLKLKVNISVKNETHYANNRSEIWCCKFSPDGNLMAWCSADGYVNILNCAQIKKTTNTDLVISNENKYLIKIDCLRPAWSLAFGSSFSSLNNFTRKDIHKANYKKTSNDDYRRFRHVSDTLILAIGLENGDIRLHDALTGSLYFVLSDHKDIVRDLKFSPNGSLQLCSVSNDSTIKLWDLTNDGNMYESMREHIGCINACDWSPTAPFLCTVGINRQAFIWDTNIFKVKHILKGHMNNVVTCQFSSDGGLLATGSFDTKVFVWDPYTGTPLKTFFHLLPPPRLIYASGYNEHYIRSLAFSKCNSFLVSISDDKTVKVWSLVNRSNKQVCVSTHIDGVCCDYSPNGQTIIIGNRNGQLSVYEAPRIVPTLVQLCRSSIRKYFQHDLIGNFELPRELEKYLCYENIKNV